MRMAVPRLSAIFLLSLLLFLQPRSSRSQESSDPKALEAAKKESEVVWYTTTALDMSKKIADRFEEKYPGIKVKLFRTGAGTLLNRVLLEVRAGRHEWDVLNARGDLVLPLLEKKLIAPYRSPALRMVDEDLVDREGYWAAFSISTWVLGFNTRMVKKEDAPGSYEALLSPRWKGGQISLDSEGYVVFQGLIGAWGMENALSYFRILANQDPILKRGSTERVQLTAAGEYPLAIAYAHTFQGMARQGAPVDWIALEPAVVQFIPVMLAANAPHPNAGKLLIDFLLSRDAQEMLRAFQRVPVRKDVELDPPRLLKGYRRVALNPKGYKDFDETIKLYREIFKLR